MASPEVVINTSNDRSWRNGMEILPFCKFLFLYTRNSLNWMDIITAKDRMSGRLFQVVDILC